MSNMKTNQNFTVPLLVLLSILMFILAVTGWMKSESNKSVGQAQKEKLIASYVRLADILKGMSGEMCQRLARLNEGQNATNVSLSCSKIDSIIIRLKTIEDLTEQQRDQYNATLTNLTGDMFSVAEQTNDKILKEKIEKYRTQINQELAILKDKNVKLQLSRNQAISEAQKTKQIVAQLENQLKQSVNTNNNANIEQLQRELQQARIAQQNAEQELRNAQQRQAQEKNTEQQILQREREKEKQTEKELAKVQEKERKEKELAEQKEREQKELQSANEQTDANENKLPTEKTNPAQGKPMSKEFLKRQLTTDFEQISPTNRNHETKNRLREQFASPNAEAIFCDNKSYSVNSYWDKLSLTGPYDIHILDLQTDKEGKIISLSIEETRLGTD